MKKNKDEYFDEYKRKRQEFQNSIDDALKNPRTLKDAILSLTGAKNKGNSYIENQLPGAQKHHFLQCKHGKIINYHASLGQKSMFPAYYLYLINLANSPAQGYDLLASALGFPAFNKDIKVDNKKFNAMLAKTREDNAKRELKEAEQRKKFISDVHKQVLKAEQNSNSHDYLKQKGFSDFGQKDVKILNPGALGRIQPTDGGKTLAIPLYTTTGAVKTYQLLFENKVELSANQFDKKKIISSNMESFAVINPQNKNISGFERLANAKNEQIFVVEGYATGLSLAKATGSIVVCAINAQMLESVVPLLAKNFPDNKYIIGADDDYSQGGKRAAEKALSNCKDASLENVVGIIYPSFDSNNQIEVDGKVKNKFTDFNDMHCQFGLDKASLEKGIESIKSAVYSQINTLESSNKFNAYDASKVLITTTVQSRLEDGRTFAKSQVSQNIREMIHLVANKDNFTREMNSNGEILLTSKSNSQIQVTINPHMGQIQLFINNENALTTNKNGVTYHPDLLNQFHNSINKNLTLIKTNDDVLKQYETKHPELIEQIRKDRYLEVLGVNGGIVQLSDNEPEKLAELLAKTTGAPQEVTTNDNSLAKQDINASINL